MQYLAWRTVTALVAVLPPRASYLLAAAAGTVGFYLWPRGRRAMLRNYGRVLPGESRARIRSVARKSLVNYCRYLVDFVRFPAIPPERLPTYVEQGPDEAAQIAAARAGSGVIFVCMHFGNWDLGAGAAAARGIPLTVVAESFGNPKLDAMVVGARERAGMRVMKMERVTPSLVRTLKQNGAVALLIDRPMPGEGVPVEFFGETVEVPAGPARLALGTGASVVPAAFERLYPNALGVTTHADFTLRHEPTGDGKRDLQQLTQAIVSAHERFIRDCPEQWYMFREMWPVSGRGGQAKTW